MKGKFWVILQHTKNPDFKISLKSGYINALIKQLLFSHPDYTVGFGITPNQSLF